jgi:hypothetical protein
VSPWRDYPSEMNTQRELDDATVEAVLRGDPLPAELEPLAQAIITLRSLPEHPVRPSPELAARMAAGEFASAAAPRPSRRSAGRHRAARSRLTALPLRAKVAAVAALAVVGLGTATVAGALPEPAQHQLEWVIESVTPIDFGDRSEFGQDVADDARDGGVDGREVSDRAKEQGGQDTPDRVQPGSTWSDSPATPAAPPDEHPSERQGKPEEPGKPANPPGKPGGDDKRPDDPRPSG